MYGPRPGDRRMLRMKQADGHKCQAEGQLDPCPAAASCLAHGVDRLITAASWGWQQHAVPAVERAGDSSVVQVP